MSDLLNREASMPIRFRCAYCNQLMGIASRKAGTVVRCPKCAGEIIVPVPEGHQPPEPGADPQPAANPQAFEDLDIDKLINAAPEPNNDATGAQRARRASSSSSRADHAGPDTRACHRNGADACAATPRLLRAALRLLRGVWRRRAVADSRFRPGSHHRSAHGRCRRPRRQQ